jgi:hypothetical protein
MQENNSNIDGLVAIPPETWIGRQLTWLRSQTASPVFIGRFQAPADGHQILLYGRRYNLADVLVAGRSHGDGHFVEYYVVETIHGDKQPTVHRLLQNGGVMHSAVSKKLDYVELSDARVRRALQGVKPSWEQRSEALWPLSSDEPMKFVGQIRPQESDENKRYLTWGVSVYLFMSNNEGPERFKIFEQFAGEQSAEDFYAESDRRQT